MSSEIKWEFRICDNNERVYIVDLNVSFVHICLSLLFRAFEWIFARCQSNNESPVLNVSFRVVLIHFCLHKIPFWVNFGQFCRLNKCRPRLANSRNLLIIYCRFLLLNEDFPFLCCEMRVCFLERLRALLCTSSLYFWTWFEVWFLHTSNFQK